MRRSCAWVVLLDTGMTAYAAAVCFCVLVAKSSGETAQYCLSSPSCVAVLVVSAA